MATANQHSKQAPSFQDLVAANRSAGRLDCTDQQAPEDNPKKMMQTGMRLLPNEFAQAKELADADERSVSWFTRRMYLRGLESYLAESRGTATAPQ